MSNRGMFCRVWGLPLAVEMVEPNRKVWMVGPQPRIFIDRDDLVEDVRKLATMKREGPLTYTLYGLSGIGKTAAMLRCANVMRNQFDVALHVDFTPVRDGGEDAMLDVVGGMLKALRVDECWIPADLDGRCRRFQEITAERRVLLLFDDVVDAAQVAALLPNSPAAFVMVASEGELEALHADGGKSHHLRGLKVADGVELLTGICQDRKIVAEPGQITRLVTMVGGSPSAIRVLASLLRSRRAPSVAQLIEEFEAEIDGGASTPPCTVVGERLTKLFDVKYRYMKPAVAQVYRILGNLPGRCWPERVIAAACDMTVAKVRPLIDALVDQDLLDEVFEDEYLMPNVVRPHARWAAVAGETVDYLNASAVRGMTVFVEDAVAADFAVLEDRFRVDEPRVPFGAKVFASEQDAMEWFARWHGELFIVARRASAHGENRLVQRLFQAMWPFYSNSSVYLHEWLEFANLAVAASQGDAAILARMLCQRARGYIEKADFVSAGADLVRALGLGRARSDGLLGCVLDFMGQFEFRQGHYGTALRHFEESLAIHEKLGDRRGIALQSQFCGRALGRLDRGPEALRALARARDLIAPLGDFRTASRIAYSRAEVLIALGEDAEAVVSLHDAIDFAAGLGQTMLFAKPLERLADIAHRLRDLDPQPHHDAELHYVEKIVALHQDSGSPELGKWEARLAELSN